MREMTGSTVEKRKLPGWKEQLLAGRAQAGV